jgi:hypothetical protein
MIFRLWTPTIPPKAGRLMRLASHAHWTAGVVAMLDMGVSPNITSECKIPGRGYITLPVLYSATAYGAGGVVAALLDRGADPNVMVRHFTAVTFAAHFNHFRIMIMLRCAGAVDNYGFLACFSQIEWCIKANDRKNMLKCAQRGDWLPVSNHPLMQTLRKPWSHASPIYTEHAYTIAVVRHRLDGWRRGRSVLWHLPFHIWLLITSLTANSNNLFKC